MFLQVCARLDLLGTITHPYPVTPIVSGNHPKPPSLNLLATRLTVAIQPAGTGTSTSCLERVLRGLADYGLESDVIIATSEPTATHASIHRSGYRGNVRMWPVPSTGTLPPAAVRNALVSEVKTPYILLLDDAMAFKKEGGFTNALRYVLESVASGQYDLIGGCIISAGEAGSMTAEDSGCHGAFELHDEKAGEISFVPTDTDTETLGVGLVRADLVDSFFVARVSRLRTVRWDEDLLQDADHEDFFLRARGKLAVGYYAPWTVSYGHRHASSSKDPGDTCELSRPVLPLGDRLRDREGPVLHSYKAMLTKNALFRFIVGDRAYELVCEDSLDAPSFPLFESGMDACAFHTLKGGALGEAAIRRVTMPTGDDDADEFDYPPDKFPRLARPSWGVPHGPKNDDASNLCQASVALMTVAIGRYMEFVPDLWASTQQYFLPDCHVELFVFTDDVTHALGQDPAIHLVGQFRLGWPYDSLMRFEMYQSQADVLKERFQYVYAVDSDAVFAAVMGREILGQSVATLSAWYQGLGFRDRFPYDANPDSPFYMAPHQGRNYFAGGFYGGEVNHVLFMWETIVPQIRHLLEIKEYVPPWHDESILNYWYHMVHPPDVVLGAEYLYPEPPADTWVTRAMQLYYKWELGKDGKDPKSFRPGREPKLLNLGTRKSSEPTDKSIRQAKFVEVADPVITSVEAGLRPRACSSGVTIGDQDSEAGLTHCMHWIPGAQDYARREETCHSLNMTQCGLAAMGHHGRWGTLTSHIALVRHPEQPDQCILVQQHFPLLSERVKGIHRGILRWKFADCDHPASAFCCVTLDTLSPSGNIRPPRW